MVKLHRVSHTYTSISQPKSISVTKSFCFFTYLQQYALLTWWPEGKLWSQQRGLRLAMTNIYVKNSI